MLTAPGNSRFLLCIWLQKDLKAIWSSIYNFSRHPLPPASDQRIIVDLHIQDFSDILTDNNRNLWNISNKYVKLQNQSSSISSSTKRGVLCSEDLRIQDFSEILTAVAVEKVFTTDATEFVWQTWTKYCIFCLNPNIYMCFVWNKFYNFTGFTHHSYGGAR